MLSCLTQPCVHTNDEGCRFEVYDCDFLDDNRSACLGFTIRHLVHHEIEKVRCTITFEKSTLRIKNAFFTSMGKNISKENVCGDYSDIVLLIETGLMGGGAGDDILYEPMRQNGWPTSNCVWCTPRMLEGLDAMYAAINEQWNK